MNDYARVEAMIRFLEGHRDGQPSDTELAAAAGLGPTQVRRLFSRWAGVTPKEFLQCLTAEHAKRRLRDSASVLDAALEAGLSGPGRLHDLLVTLEAASPGEYKSRGRGLVIRWGRAESPFGHCTAGWTGRGVCHLAFHDAPPGDVPGALRSEWPEARFDDDDAGAARLAGTIFAHPAPSGPPLRAFVRATPFRVSVWRALLRIPAGAVAGYGRLARAIGSPDAARAVGTACGANPVAWLIPCHRVIRETGAVDGYRWGTERKRAILAREWATAPAA